MSKLISVAAVVAAAVSLVFVGCGNHQPAARAPLPVRTAVVQTIDTGNSVKYSASIVPYSQVDLAFKSSGYVDRILQVKSADGHMRNVDQGDWVRKGAVLALVHPRDFQDSLQQAQAQLRREQAENEKAKLTFDRTSALYAVQSATKPDYDSAKAQLDATTASVSLAKAQVSEAQTALRYCSLLAPFDGWIVKRTVDIGSLVGPSTTGFTISDTRTVKVIFGVPDVAMGRIKPGQNLSITTDALPGSFQGRVSTISAEADPKSRVYSVEVSIQNPRNELRSGMIATLSIGGEKFPQPVAVVPLEAVVRDPRQAGAFAVMTVEHTGDTATAHLRSVQLGDAYGDKVAIAKGVEVGQYVVTTGVNLIKDGDGVRLLP